MQLGIREFRERLSELAHGSEPVTVTHHGRVLGRFLPEGRKKAEDIDMDRWVDQRRHSQQAWRERTPDWRERLAAFGLGPDGESLAE